MTRVLLRGLPAQQVVKMGILVGLSALGLLHGAEAEGTCIVRALPCTDHAGIGQAHEVLRYKGH